MPLKDLEARREYEKAYHKKRYAEKRDEVRHAQKEYREANRLRLKEKHRAYYAENKDELLRKQKEKDALKRDDILKNKKAQARGPARFETFGVKLSAYENVKDEDGLLSVACAYCGRFFLPTRRQCCNRVNSLNGIGSGENKFYCSDNCKIACPVYRQRWHYKGNSVDNSSREIQPELRKLALERDGYACQKCGTENAPLHCHHIKPVGDEPIESADLDNVITLCVGCHHLVHSIPGCGTSEIGRC